MKKYWWLLPVVLAAATLLVWQLPADSWKPRMTAAIERGLNRKVEVQGEAQFVPWRLGFSLSNVVIQDDARYGVEPLAYVDTLEATVRLTALLAGRFEIDRLRLVDTSVNLAQGPNGWNFPALLNQAVAAARGVAPPEVEVTGGRINVRFGETKSLYYLGDSILTLEAGDRPNSISVYFEGVPARTDRAAKGFGRLSARGTVDLDGKRGWNLSVSLARSAASELLLLFQDQGSSVSGFFSGRARVTGPLDALAIDGRVELHEFERWAWIAPRSGGPGVDWGGTLNWGAQKLHLETKSKGQPVSVSLDGEQLLGAAQWHSHVRIQEAPAMALENLAAQFGFTLPGGSQIEGQLNGEVDYLTSRGMVGDILFSGGTLAISGKQATVDPAAIHFEGWSAALAPVVIRQEEDVVRVEAHYRWKEAPGLSWAFSGKELDLGRASDWGMALPGGIRSGQWQGTLRYEAATGGWQGEGDLSDAEISVEGLDAKAVLDAAHLRLQGGQFALSKISGRLDELPFRGDFQFNPGAGARSQLRLQMDELPVGKLRQWFAPALERQTGVLSRTFGIGRPAAPEWLEERRLSAQVSVGQMRLGESALAGPFAAKLEWDGGLVRLANLSGPGRMKGEGEIRLAPSEEAAAGESVIRVENANWRGGLADVTLRFELERPEQRGRFTVDARDLTLVEGERWPAAHFEGDFGLSDGSIRLEPIEVRPKAADEAAILRGTGRSLESGEWEWTLRSAAGNRKLTGPPLEGAWR